MLETSRAGDAETLPTWRAFPGRAGAATKATDSLPRTEERKGRGKPWPTLSALPSFISAGKVPTGGLQDRLREIRSSLMVSWQLTRQHRPRCRQLAISPLANFTLFEGKRQEMGGNRPEQCVQKCSFSARGH